MQQPSGQGGKKASTCLPAINQTNLLVCCHVELVVLLAFVLLVTRLTHKVTITLDFPGLGIVTSCPASASASSPSPVVTATTATAMKGKTARLPPFSVAREAVRVRLARTARMLTCKLRRRRRRNRRGKWSGWRLPRVNYCISGV